MEQFFGTLGTGPGLAFMIVVVMAGIQLGFTLKEKLTKAIVPHRSGEFAGATWQVSMTGAMANLLAAINALGDKTERSTERYTLMSERILGELAEIRRIGEASEVRLDQLATREDVAASAAGHFQTVAMKLQSIHDDVRDLRPA